MPSEKIRVALCITELYVGGAERVLTELAVRLDKSRFEPFVCSMKPKPPENMPSFLPQLRDAKIPVEFLNFKSPLSLVGGLLRLRKIFQKRKPHVCQSFLFHANLLTRLAVSPQIKFFAKRQAEQGTPRIFSGIRVAEHEKRWHLRLDWLTQSLVEKYVCVSGGVADFTKTNGGISCDKIIVIPNGIDVDEYQTLEKADLTFCGCSPQTKKILVVGRLHRQKGIDWLLQTADIWFAARNDCELLIVGDGKERETLERLASEKTYHSRIHFLGNRQDVPQILAASDLLLSPSRWEGMSNVVMQAMAAGLPVVVSDAEGTDELILRQAAVSGVSQNMLQTCRFGDAAAFAERINNILDNANLAAQLGTQNRDHLRRNFKIQQMVEAYQKIWEESVRG